MSDYDDIPYDCQSGYSCKPESTLGEDAARGAGPVLLFASPVVLVCWLAGFSGFKLLPTLTKLAGKAATGPVLLLILIFALFCLAVFGLGRLLGTNWTIPARFFGTAVALLMLLGAARIFG